MDVAFVALNLSVLLQVVFGFGPLAGAGQLQGLSGGLGLLALVAFGIVLRRSFSAKQRVSYARRAAAAGMQRFAQVRVSRSRPATPIGTTLNAAPSNTGAASDSSEATGTVRPTTRRLLAMGD
jgi:hypothetical protein